MLVFFEHHLNIHTREFTQMPVSKWILSPEHRPDLEHSFQVRADSHLLVQLWGLSQACINVELLGFEHSWTTLTRACDQFGSVDFDEVFVDQVVTPELADFGFDFLDGLRGCSSQI